MNLSRRVIVAVVATDLILLAILFGFVGTVTIHRFEDIEKANLERNLARTEDAINAELDSLSSKNGDWSNWNDPYQFAVDRNQEFIDSNQSVNSFQQLKVNVMFFFDNENALIEAKRVDLDEAKEILVTPELIEVVKSSPLTDNPDLTSSHTGIIAADNEILLVSSRPILTSDGTGPSHGTLVFARLLNKELIKQISETTHLTLEFFTPSHPEADEDFVSATSGLSAEGTKVILPSEQDIEGHIVAKDISGRIVGYWQVTQQRSIYQAGRQASRLFLIVFLVVGTTFAFFLLYILQILVLKRLRLFSSTVKKIEESEDLTLRLPERSTDEIGTLGIAVNQLLTRLGSSLGLLRAKQNELETKSKSEEHLRQTITDERDQAAAIIESMGEGLLVLNKSFDIIRINKAAQKLLEITEREAIGRKWNDTVTAYLKDKEIPFEERSAVKVMKTGRPITTKLEDAHYFAVESGRKFPVVSTTTPFRGHGLNGVVIVFRDVTKELMVVSKIEEEVKERTREAQETKARLISSINSLTIGFIMTDLNRNILLVNQTAMDIIHYEGEPEELDSGSENIHVVTINSIAESIKQKYDLLKGFEQCLSYKKPISVQDIMLGQKDVEMYLSPILLEGESLGVVLLIVDVSSEKQLARAKDDFLSIASHELRTPMTAIMGNASLIQEYFADQIKDKNLKEMIDDMRSASERLIALINDFLNVSRLEQGRITFRQEEVSLGKVARGVADEIKPNIKPSVKLIIESKEDIVVAGDEMKIKEVLTNLIGNSLKYTEKGKVTVSWEKKAGQALIRVADTGIGIAAANKSLLFQKFQQAGTNSITRDSTRSSGLGLYISKLLVGNMGGTIGLESSVIGKGSVFYFSVPLKNLTKKKA